MLSLGNTSNLRQHLKAKHLTEFKVVDQHLKQLREMEIGPAKRRCQAAVDQKPLVQAKFPLESAGTKWTSECNPKQTLITQKIAQMICIDMQPYSIVEDKGFRELIKAAEPRYVMPSRKTFSTEIIPNLYSQTVATVKSDVNNAVSLALTTDGWTSRANNSYLSYTAHFLTEKFEPRNYCLNVEVADASHNSKYLANSLSQIISAWTTEEQRRSKMKLFVIADNAANIQAALNSMTVCKSLSCFAHTLQLAINGAISNCSEIQTTIKKVKSIAAHFRHSVQSTQKLLSLEKQMGLPQLKLKQDCPTRWNSTYDMLERLLLVKDAVSAVLASTKKVETLNGNEWEIAEACVEILKPFKVATATLSAFKYPSVSMVIPTINQLKYHLQLDCDKSTCLQILKENLVNNIDTRWPSYEFNTAYAIATIIDPRYKDCGFQDPEAIVEARRMVLKEMASQTDLLCESSTAQLTTITPQENDSGGI